MREVPFLELTGIHRRLANELTAAWQRVLHSGRYILGPELEAFEEEFARYCGVRYAVGVGSGLDGLRWVLEAAGIGPGDEVLVPAQTFVATWLAVSSVGALPVAVDIEPESGNLDPERVVAAASSRTRAVIAVHLYGRPAAVDRLEQLARRHGWFLLEDAAQAHGAKIRGQSVGGWGNAAAFSFYPAKNLGALGDGGAVTTNDAQLADRVRVLRNYGSRVKYHHEMLGGNSRLDELQAAFLRVKLPFVESWNDLRRQQAARYRELLVGVPGLGLPPLDDDSVLSSWHLFVIRVSNREEIRARLRDFGVETLVHYPVAPVDLPAYSGRFREPEPCHEARKQSREVISLPLGPHLQASDLDYVAQKVREAVIAGA
jgi:dTDP-3-amino-3,4,6-trideoxy-alpha-D-glucose transaminase